jgi:hypothetical protein
MDSKFFRMRGDSGGGERCFTPAVFCTPTQEYKAMGTTACDLGLYLGRRMYVAQAQTQMCVNHLLVRTGIDMKLGVGGCLVFIADYCYDMYARRRHVLSRTREAVTPDQASQRNLVRVYYLMYLSLIQLTQYVIQYTTTQTVLVKGASCIGGTECHVSEAHSASQLYSPKSKYSSLRTREQRQHAVQTMQATNRTLRCIKQ